MKNNFSTPGFLWPLLTLACIVVILTGLRVVLKKTNWEKNIRNKTFFGIVSLLTAWIGLLTIFSYNGFFTDFSKLPPRPALAMLIPLPIIILIAFSRTGTQLLQKTPSHWLVVMQSFRVLVELLLLFAFMAGKLPVQMTFEGRNFDVITGILALPVGYLIARKKTYSSKLILAFNIIGIVLLLNILVIAVLSMPTSIRYFMNEPSNTLVGQFPFILLPGVLVPIAYTMHIFSLRQLLTKQSMVNVKFVSNRSASLSQP
ncbi:MAG TPA: hypothetical protein VHQ93_21260 [Chitinophagaceae bacterium]|jgi:uncharacterized membrane protein|nr:hypothetical protein [Chitinophagaceae bacterium]